jgi:hypothetical protein
MVRATPDVGSVRWRNPAAIHGVSRPTMLLANLVVVVVTTGACVLLTLDSIPAKAVRYALVRWRHRRKVGASSHNRHEHALFRPSVPRREPTPRPIPDVEMDALS